MTRKLPRAVACFLAAALGAGATPPPSDTTLTLEQAIALATAANRSLRAARLGLPVARAEVEVARGRQNPEFALEAQRETPHGAAGLSFPLELGGKRARRVDEAQAAFARTEAELAQLELETRVRVRRAFYAQLADGERLTVAQDLVSLAAKTRDAARDRFESGAAPRLELLEAELALGEAENDVSAAAAALEAARSTLNTLLALAPDRPTAPTGDLGAGTLPAPEAAEALALGANRELAVVDRKIAEAEARVRLARAERVPDLVLGGALTTAVPDEFDVGWRASLSLLLPIFNTHRAEVHVAEYGLEALHAEREAQADTIRGAVHAALATAEAARQRILRYREATLVQAAEVEEMAADSYRSGQTGLLMLLQAHGAVREVRRRSIEAGTDYQAALAELELAIGAPLP